MISRRKNKKAYAWIKKKKRLIAEANNRGDLHAKRLHEAELLHTLLVEKPWLPGTK